MNSKQDMTQQFWKDRYQGINRANSLLVWYRKYRYWQNPTRTRSRGEAKFLRAFYYYELASIVRTRPSDNHLAIRRAKPTNAAELWGLNPARPYVMPPRIMPTLERRTDMSINTHAEAMLGRAWLFYTGMYCNGEDLGRTDQYHLLTVDFRGFVRRLHTDKRPSDRLHRRFALTIRDTHWSRRTSATFGPIQTGFTVRRLRLYHRTGPEMGGR